MDIEEMCVPKEEFDLWQSALSSLECLADIAGRVVTAHDNGILSKNPRDSVRIESLRAELANADHLVRLLKKKK